MRRRGRAGPTRRSRFVFCFAGVCRNALLEESLVIHGCSEEGALPHYGCRNQSFHCRLGAFKKMIEKYCLLSNNTIFFSDVQNGNIDLVGVELVLI